MARSLFDTSVGEPKPSPEDFLYEFVEVLGGIDQSIHDDLLESTSLKNAINVRLDKGRLVRDFGYITFAQTVIGNPRATYQFFKSDGTDELVLVTNSTFYTYSSGADEWQLVSNGTDTTLSSGAATSATSLTVADITGFADGDLIGITLDDGTQHQTTVDGTPAGSTINIDDALPSAAGSGKAVVNAVSLSGSDDIMVSFDTMASENKMFFTNYADTPQVYDGTTCEDVSGLPGSSFKAKIVQVVETYLVFMHTEESGTAYPQRVRWSATGNPASYPSSNYTDLYSSEDHITAAAPLGPYTIIYKERTIIRMEFANTDDVTWDFTDTVSGEGTVNQDTVIDLGDVHLLWGQSNIYEYDGGFTLKPVGDKVYEKIFSQEGELSPQNTSRTFGFYVEELDEVWFFYTASGDTYPQNMLRYKIQQQTWHSREFTIGITGYGFFAKTSSTRWQDALGIWSDAIWSRPWIAKSSLTNSPTVHLCSEDNQVYEYDFTTVDDNGADIPWSIESKNFYVPNRSIRTDRYDLNVRGSNIVFEVSYDGGNTYNQLKVINSPSDYTKISVYKQQKCASVLLRLSGDDDFGIKRLGISYKRESIL